MSKALWTGFWTMDAPLGPDEVEADQAILSQFVVPDGAIMHRAEVYVHGRLWYWEEVAVDLERHVSTKPLEGEGA